MGQASDLIKSIVVIGNNYKNAWKHLCKRFDSKPILVMNQIETLFDISVVKYETAKQMQNFVAGSNSARWTKNVRLDDVCLKGLFYLFSYSFVFTD